DQRRRGDPGVGHQQRYRRRHDLRERQHGPLGLRRPLHFRFEARRTVGPRRHVVSSRFTDPGGTPRHWSRPSPSRKFCCGMAMPRRCGMNSRRVTGLVAGLLAGVTLLGLARPAWAEPRARAAAPVGLSVGEWQSIVTQIRERPYRLEPAAGGGYRVANPAQGWTVAFDPDGV